MQQTAQQATTLPPCSSTEAGTDAAAHILAKQAMKAMGSVVYSCVFRDSTIFV